MTTATQTAPETNQLATIVRESGLAIEKASALIEALSPLVAKAGELVREADGITVTDATQLTEMRQARACRLALKAVRCEGENVRKELKADVTATGRAIDEVARWLKNKIEPAEAKMQEAEDFAVRAEAARREQLAADRSAALRPFCADPSLFKLADMSPAAFDDLLRGQKHAHEERQREAAEAEKKRIADEEKRRAEEARVRAENDRLRKERDDANKKLRDEQEAARKELAAKQAVIDEQNRKAAEQKAEEDRKAKAAATAARKAARAPDRQRIVWFAESIAALPVPAIKDPNLQPLLRDIEARRAAFVAWINEQAEAI